MTNTCKAEGIIPFSFSCILSSLLLKKCLNGITLLHECDHYEHDSIQPKEPLCLVNTYSI